MNVLSAASECAPFVKTGGLADVVGSLPAGLLSLGKKAKGVPLRVTTVLPKYSQIDTKKFRLQKLPGKILVPVGDALEEGRIWRLEEPLGGKIPRAKANAVYFIESGKFFNRDGIYQSDGRDFEDNDERFIFFCRAALELCKFIDFVPDVAHCHDWQTGLLPAYLKTLYASDAFFHGTASLFTIHNLAYQGNFPKESLFYSGFGWHDFVPEKLEYYGQFSFLKAGLVYADKLNAVSPTYAAEIQESPLLGCGMEGVLKARSSDLSGILNGLDTKEWDPAKDAMIAARFSHRSRNLAEARALCREDLQREAGLPMEREALLVGMVSRLDPQKGHAKLIEIVPQLEAGGENFQWVILGSGNAEIQEQLTALAGRYPERISFQTGFKNALAHKIYAGSDVIFMPSEYEPCGLSHLIGMRYGSLPVATPTGGLIDSVRNLEGGAAGGTGFLSRDLTAASLLEALAAAARLFRDKAAWLDAVRRVMREDFSWQRSALGYLELYRAAMEKRRE